MDVVTVLSGGLDSTVLAHYLDHAGFTQTFVTFDYGQKHRREIECAEQTAAELGRAHVVIPIDMHDFWQGSSLVGPSAVPEGHYEAESMRSTVVPNRNLLFLTLAATVAVAYKASRVYIGVHSGDHAIYQDCRPEFIDAANTAIKLSCGVEVFAPFVNLTKANIVSIGALYNVPFENTWSCYKGDILHCGKCGTCVERKEAFELANVKDPTHYV